MPTYASFLPTFLPCLFIFLACGSVIAHPSVLKPFFLQAIPEEASGKHGSRIRRLARPDVSQGQAYLLPSFLPIFLPCLFVFLPFGSVFASFDPLTFLSTSYLKKCLASTGLATDVSHGQTSAMTQGQTSRKRRLARTGVPTLFCDPPASTEVSQQMSRKDRRPYFYFACSSSEPLVWLLYLLLSFTFFFLQVN